MTDANGSVTTYAYNLDDTVSGVSYVTGQNVGATPNETYTYDPIYNRVSTITDGTGTTTYIYKPGERATGQQPAGQREYAGLWNEQTGGDKL